MADREHIDSIVFYRSFFEAVEDLEDSETKLQAYQAIFRYGLDGEETELKGAAKAIFRLVKPQIDANYEKRVNGRKGGKPPQSINKTKEKPSDNQSITKTEPNHNQTATKPEPNVNVNGNVNVNVNDNVNGNEKVDCKAVAALFNDICTSLPRIKGLNAKRETHIKHLLKKYSEEDIREVFQKARDSDFLNGDNGKGWKASFDWLIIESNFQKVGEGNYDNKGRRRKEDCINDTSQYGYHEGMYDDFKSAVDDAQG